MTISAAHQKAIDTLSLSDIYVQSLNAQYVDDFNPKYCDFLNELETQGRHNILGYNKLEFENGKCVIQIQVDLATRLVRQQPAAQGHNPIVCAFIEANYIAEYAMPEPLEDDALNEFALRNASYHVWPFWRELVASQCTRMQLPKIVLPLQQFAKNGELALKEMCNSED